MNLTENNYLNFLKRRYSSLDNHIRSSYEWLNTKMFGNFDEFIDRVIFSTTRDFTSDWEQDYDEVLKLRDNIGDEIKKYIMTNFYDEIYQYYMKETVKEDISRIKEILKF